MTGMNTTFPYIIFQLNDDLYALNVEHVTEVTNTDELNALPQMTSYMRGLFQLREDVIPIIDLKERIGLPSDRKTNESHEERFIIVKTSKKYVGLKVDAVREIVHFEQEHFRSITAEQKQWSNMVEGVYRWDGTLVLILNLEAVLDFTTLIDLSDWKDTLQLDDDETTDETEQTTIEAEDEVQTAT